MMTLSDRINEDLKTAMKEKDSFKLGVIRMIKGAMQLAKPNPREELNDDDVVGVISKQIKMRKESIKEFEKAGRDDLVTQNLKEIEILEAYMPEQLSEEELDKIIDKVFELRYLENRGAAFGMLQNQKYLFLVIATVMLLVIFYILVRLPLDKKYYVINACLILIAAGAVGNMIDRVVNEQEGD